MTIKAGEYETLRAWSAKYIEHMMPFLVDMPPEVHPIICLDAMALKSASRARQGLAMMIGDFMEDADRLPQEDVARLDAVFSAEGLPTFSAIRLRFMKRIAKILSRGVIHSEVEYHAVRNVVEGTGTGADQQRLWNLLADFERKTVV